MPASIRVRASFLPLGRPDVREGQGMRFLEDNGVLYEQEGPVMWRCEGCGFRLDLPASIAPPMWHTLDRPMGTAPGEFPDCPNVNWIKLGERAKAAPRG